MELGPVSKGSVVAPLPLATLGTSIGIDWAEDPGRGRKANAKLIVMRSNFIERSGRVVFMASQSKRTTAASITVAISFINWLFPASKP